MVCTHPGTVRQSAQQIWGHHQTHEFVVNIHPSKWTEKKLWAAFLPLRMNSLNGKEGSEEVGV